VRNQPSEALARIGALFQQRTLDLDLTVADNLRYHAALQGMSRRDATQRIDIELARAGLLERLKDKVRSLSGGQMRRVEIAGALLHRPRLLLLDEPTVGVDIGARQAILDHVHRLCREDGLGVLWATHLIDEVNPGDDVVVLHQGRVLAHGDVDAVARAADSPNIRAAFTKLTGTGKP
jgi:ABC-2 type transport system ATP-binding protein